MLTPLLATLVLLSQAPAPAPASPDVPITVLIAPPDTAGVPGHVVEFAQEHVAEQARSKGLTVKRMKDVLKRLPAAKRRALLKCKRTDLRCLISLGDAAKTEVVLIAELMQRMDGYRVGIKMYRSVDGALVGENLVSGVREDGMLDALTQSLEVAVPKMRQALRPSENPPENTPGTGTTGTGTGTGEGSSTTAGTGTGQGSSTTTGTGTGQGSSTTAGTGTGQGSSTTTGTGTGQGSSITTGTGTGQQPPPPPPPARSSLRSWAWAPAAGGVLFAGAGTFFMLQARDKYNKLDSGPGPQNGAQLEKDGKKAQTLSRVAFGVGAAGIVTGAVFFLVGGEQQPSVRPTVSVGPAGGMVGVAGTLP